jgi:hypothetical protein
MLETVHIKDAIKRNGTLSVYQLAILDYLNTVKKPEDISGIEPSTGPISDDPKMRGRGYDIGITVAKRILQRRKQLGGNFSNLDQLAGIPYFGEDKLHDLIYTFMSLRSPIPTGLGADFDKFIIALGQLEVNALKADFSPAKTLSAIRKVIFDKTVSTDNQGVEVKLNWDKVIPKSKAVKPPAPWIVQSDLNRAMDFVASNPVIQIGSEKINAHTLIATLDARTHPSKLSTGDGKLDVKSNAEASSFLMGLAKSTYKYLSSLAIRASQSFDIEQKVLTQRYDQEMGTSEYAAIADAFAMEFDTTKSLSWNLLNYYRNTERPSGNRYQKLASSMALGEYKDGLFSNDNNTLRTKLLKDILSVNFFLLRENGHTTSVNRMMSGEDNDKGYMAYKMASAFTLDLFLDKLTLFVGIEVNMPTIVSWNRLEARPRSEDFSRTLKAEVRDALWFISRQWQFGEFLAEDNGSALEMRIDMQTSKVSKYALRDNEAKAFDVDIPMETTVEREPVHMDLTIRLEMGRQFERFARKILREDPGGFAQSSINNIIADLKAESTFQFILPTPPDEHPDVYSNPSLLKSFVAIRNGRMLDGGAVYKTVKEGVNVSGFVTSTNSANALSRVDSAAQSLVDWFEKVYNQPESDADTAWTPNQLEHQFQCSVAASPSAMSVLNATEYANGHLDWYSFDFETNPNKYSDSLVDQPINQDLIQRKLITVLPTDLQYPGMPKARWWQFEDFKVDLGDINTNTNEIPKLLMTEFALIYSNDWMLVPFDVNVGCLCDIKSVVVRDVFGQYTSVKAAGAGDNSDWKRWSMFNLNRKGVTSGVADTRLFVPPAVVRTMESEPIERVGLLRDEMANMVWGIEKIIPDGQGGAMDGDQAARRLYDYLVKITPEQPPLAPPVDNVARIKYGLGTTVPENWIPFIPVRLGGITSRQIQLRRAAMPRIINGRTTERIRPQTMLLRTGHNEATNTWGPYFLHEEEVPRSGVIVERKWQRSRWMNGKTYTWLGRRVRNGRGEANSGLEFDLVKEK